MRSQLIVAALLTLAACGRVRFVLHPEDAAKDAGPDASGEDAGDPDGGAIDAARDTAIDGDDDDDDALDAALDGPDASFGEDGGGPTRASTTFTLVYGSTTFDWSYGVGVDRDGNAYVAGSMFGPLDLGGGELAKPEGCGFIASYDALGAHRFSETYCAEWACDGRNVVVSPEGTIHVVGHASGNLRFVDPPTYRGDGQSAFTIRFDPDGTRREALVFDASGSGNAQAYAIDVRDGQLAIGGLYRTTFDFGGGVTLGSAMQDDGWVAAFDASAAPRFARGYTEPGEGGQVVEVAWSADGHLAVVGHFDGSVDFEGRVTNVTGSAAFVAVYAEDGALLGAHVLTSSTGDAVLWDVAATPAGGFVTVGYASGAVGVGATALGAANGRDAVFVELDGDGTLARAWLAPAPNDQALLRVAIDPEGRTIASGQFRVEWPIDGLTALVAAGGTDAVVLRAEDGAITAARSFGGAGDEQIWGVAVDPGSYDVVTTGRFNGAFVGPDATGATSRGADDVFIVRLSLDP